MRPLIALFLTLSAAYAAPILTVNFSATPLIGNPGQTLTFSGTLENTTNSVVFINSNTFTFDIAGTGVVDDSLFLSNAPFSLDALEISKPFDFFTVTIPALQASGPYSGAFTVLGGPDELASDVIGGPTSFAVDVTPASAEIPEPASFVLMAAGLGLLAWKRRGQLQKR